MEIYELEKHSQPIIGMAARTDENGKALYTPFNQQRIVSIYNDSAFYDDIDVAIHLPPELIQETKTGFCSWNYTKNTTFELIALNDLMLSSPLSNNISLKLSSSLMSDFLIEV